MAAATELMEVFRRADEWVAKPGDNANVNLYLYCASDPINRIDPSGHVSLAEGLAVAGLGAMLISILIPSIHGALQQAYHVNANGTTQNIFTATFMGRATIADWIRVSEGFNSGGRAGLINDLDTLSFHLINPLHDYRNQLWKSEGLQQSWVGTVANGFAWTGTGLLYSAMIVYGFGAAGRTMDVAVQYSKEAPRFIHFEYGANGEWFQAVGNDGAMRIITGSGQGLRLTGIPVLFPGAVADAEAEAGYNCATTVLKALFRGWKFW